MKNPIMSHTFSNEISSQVSSLCKESDVPFFLYDLDHLKRRSIDIQSHAFDGLKLYYAMKANPLSKIVKTIYQTGFGIDVASEGELNQALKQKVEPKEIIFTGPYKSKKSLAYFLSKGVRFFVVESARQMKDLDELVKTLDVKVSVLLRVQLEWEGEENKILGGQEITAFGQDLESLSTQKDLFASLSGNIQIKGFHIFQWGNITDESKLFFFWEKALEELQKFASNQSLSFEIVDLGGGLGLDYERGLIDLDNNRIFTYLESLRAKFKLQKIFLELGRYLSGPIGRYYNFIGDLKRVRGENIVVLQAGINHLLRPAVVGDSFPSRVISINAEVKNETHNDTHSDTKNLAKTYHLHGPLCTSLDKLGEYVFEEKLEVGDCIVFYLTGAYGFNEAISYFLCHPTPAEYVLENNEISVIRQSVLPDNYLR